MILLSTFTLIFVCVLLVVVALLLLWAVWAVLRSQARMRRALDVHMFEVLLPKDLSNEQKEGEVGQHIKERIAVAEQFLSTLTRLPVTSWDRLLYGPPIAVFEIVAKPNGLISFYAGVERRFSDHLEKQIYALYPDAEVRPASDYTIFEAGDTVQAGYLKLRRSNHLPLATYLELEADPMQAITGALARIQKRDAATVQFVCRPAPAKTRRQGRGAAQRVVRGAQPDVVQQKRLVRLWQWLQPQKPPGAQQGSQLTPQAQKRVELVEQKMSQPHFEVTIRLVVSTRAAEEATRVVEGLSAAFAQYDMPDLNSLQFVRVRGRDQFLRDMVFRVPHAPSSVLSTTELASLFHFPLATTGTPNIAWRGAKVAPPHGQLPVQGLLLGVNVYRGTQTSVYMQEDDRRRHLYMIGQTGTGKTTLFLNMIVQDIEAGRGVGVVDPHGDLIEDILLHIPEARRADVILFDPRDTEQLLGFNILEVHDERQKDMVVNEVVQILQKLAARLNPESIGPMFEHYLRNALLALAEDPQATLIDVPRMFVDKEFRQTILKHNTNPTVRQFWDQEFQQSQRGQLSADMLSYVISKLGRFISNRTMRNIIGQPKSAFNVRKVMDEGKILLCNLSKGSLGDINSDLLGFVLVSQIQIAALGRADVPEPQRRDFYLYLDEFQNFTTDSIAVILSEARKYHLNLHLTHQFIAQLDEKIRTAVFGNVGTLISYRVGAEDGDVLATHFGPVFSDYDLINLERFTACIRLLLDGTPQRPFSLKVLPPPARGDAEGREVIRQLSRRTYGRPRHVIEQEILQRFHVETPTPEPPPSGSASYMSESLLDVK